MSDGLSRKVEMSNWEKVCTSYLLECLESSETRTKTLPRVITSTTSALYLSSHAKGPVQRKASRNDLFKAFMLTVSIFIGKWQRI